ncbi:hypothetical protein ASPWEDRAFT_166199 [Aspergillus wentii DTO 134E9]|uniref:Thioesterase domain-containing protein n=1 Tax=Aspergillus wentii DTO 134E9 TaxID=1073089 RepID=A0A1L9RYX1_ASPWE|nr:uncharacterized protein ASPWEDRAFT_166199 [Aspergillus wentii DTO 134E9]KAI9932547.1 hypothetical protein MW887_008789 [Aspergillus wentii]OJJ40112.1 hypothetical protein ASPWEDRAFT_166199 [Aspergillus wentii DTO 134E9]
MDFQNEIEKKLQTHPLVSRLRTNPSFQESRYYIHVPAALRPHMFTTGSLLFRDKVPVPPLAFFSKGGTSFFNILYIGPDLCGYPGMAHGGLLATIMDEGLLGCASAALPAQVGVTIQLQIEYLKPAPTDSFYVLKARTVKLEGKTVSVEGSIHTLEDGQPEEGEAVAEAYGEYLQPPSTRNLYPPC